MATSKQTLSQREVNPLLIALVVLGLLLLIGVIYFLTNKSGPPVNATDTYSKKILADPDPPHHRR